MLSKVRLTADLIEAFAGVFLSPMYDEPSPTPDCHREWWEMYCSDASQVGLAAPREHAKSTALTHVFGLAAAVFRVEPHILLVSATEELSLGHLGDIAKELRDNEELRSEFLIDKFVVDSKGEVIVRCTDLYEFRIIARGAGQKLRGMKWHGRRPGLIICDDMEEDEQVENLDRRRKFRRWVMRALVPLGRKGAKIRWHGTILHEDSMLSRIMRDKTWTTRLYKAHASFDDFSNILWPEQWSEARLRARRQSYIEQGDPAGYSQEYLNDPHDNEDSYLRKEDFLAINQEERERSKLICAGMDFAVSQKDHANRTSITVGGKCSYNLTHVVHNRADRWDSLQIVDQMFEVQRRWGISTWFVEGGQIWLALAPFVRKEMLRRDRWLNIQVLQPIKDKAVRGRPFQARHRAGAMRFDKEASWYPVYEAELLLFTGSGEAKTDDRFDSTATLMLGFEQLTDVEDEDFLDEEELEELEVSRSLKSGAGRNVVTGY